MNHWERNEDPRWPDLVVWKWYGPYLLSVFRRDEEYIFSFYWTIELDGEPTPYGGTAKGIKGAMKAASEEAETLFFATMEGMVR